MNLYHLNLGRELSVFRSVSGSILAINNEENRGDFLDHLKSAKFYPEVQGINIRHKMILRYVGLH